MEERMITVVIPTYNRFDCMKYFFENCFLKYTGKLFTFEIHDSSEDDRVKEYIDVNIGDSPILKYFKYDSSINGDVKAMQAILKVQTDYVYLYGDGVIMDFNQWENWLINNNFLAYYLIGIEGKTGKEFGETTICITSQEVFNFWDDLTLFGASIVKREIFSNDKMIKKYIDIKSPFSYICSVFEGLSLKCGPSIFISVKNWKENIPGGLFNPYKKSAGWYARGEVLKVWYYELGVGLLLLPNIYDRNIIYSRRRDCGASFKYLFGLRLSKNLTFSKLRRYRKAVVTIIGRKSFLKMYISLLFPVWFLKLAYKIRHRKKA